MHVLVVEDDPAIAAPLVGVLERAGFTATHVGTGRDALAADAGDVVLLDLGLPDMDGLDVCRSARSEGYPGGIMIVTARGDEMDRVVGLDFGADDYLAKPFGLAELQARVRALLRRSQGPAAHGVLPTARAGGLRLDVEARRVFADQEEVSLTTKEFDVLALLDEQRNKVVSRSQLMAEVWDENWFGSTKTLDVTIGRLRQKLEDAAAQERVVAVRGVGFRLEDPPGA